MLKVQSQPFGRSEETLSTRSSSIFWNHITRERKESVSLCEHISLILCLPRLQIQIHKHVLSIIQTVKSSKMIALAKIAWHRLHGNMKQGLIIGDEKSSLLIAPWIVLSLWGRHIQGAAKCTFLVRFSGIVNTEPKNTRNIQLANSIYALRLQVRILHEKHVCKCCSKIRPIKGTAFLLRWEDVIAFATVQLDAELLGIVTLTNRYQWLPITLHPRASSKTLLTKFFRHKLKTPVCDDETRVNKSVQNLGSALS